MDRATGQIRIVVFTKGTCAMRENILVEECAKNSKKALTVKKPMLYGLQLSTEEERDDFLKKFEIAQEIFAISGTNDEVMMKIHETMEVVSAKGRKSGSGGNRRSGGLGGGGSGSSPPQGKPDVFGAKNSKN